MNFEVGKIYSFSNKDGAYLYKGGDPSDKNSWQSNILSGPVASAGSGLTFAFQDELVGGIRGALDPNLSVKDAIQLEREALKDYQKKSPAASLGYEVGGAALPAIATFGGSAPLSTAKIGTTAVKAAGSGFTYGLGAGESPQDKLLQGLMTAPFSAGVGATGALVAKPLGNVKDMVVKTFQNPAKAGEKEAIKLVKEALDFDNTDINSAIKYILDRKGKSYALADIGPNTRAYLDAVNVLPGPGKKTAKDFLMKRNSGQLDRIKSDLTDAFGKQGTYFDTYKALEQVRKAGGAKLYEQAYKKNIAVSDDLTSLFKTDVMKDALSKAYKIANAKKINLPKLVIGKNGKLYTSKGAEITDVSTKFLHYIKLGLDDTIYTSKSPTSGVGKTLLRANTEIKNEFLDFVDSNNPAYKVARNQWAEKSAILDALQSGRNILKPSTNVDELADELSRMSQSEKLAFRNGVMNTIIEKMESSVFDAASGRGTNLAFNIIKTPKNKKLLRLTFPDGEEGTKSFNKFMSKLNDEVQIKDTANQVVGNSATVSRGETVSRIKNIVTPDDVQNLSAVGLVYGLFKSNFSELSEEAQVAASNKLAQMLTTTNPKALEQIRKEVSDKGFTKQIFDKYLGPMAGEVLKAPFNPRVTGVGAGSIAQPGIENISENVQLENFLNQME
jgi:hypothetical protein